MFQVLKRIVTKIRSNVQFSTIKALFAGLYIDFSLPSGMSRIRSCEILIHPLAAVWFMVMVESQGNCVWPCPANVAPWTFYCHIFSLDILAMGVIFTTNHYKVPAFMGESTLYMHRHICTLTQSTILYMTDIYTVKQFWIRLSNIAWCLHGTNISLKQRCLAIYTSSNRKNPSAICLLLVHYLLGNFHKVTNIIFRKLPH